MWHEIKKQIAAHDRFLLATHVDPDGDGIGAATALAELLRLMGKRAQFITGKPVPGKYSFLNFHQNYICHDPEKSYNEWDVLILLDTHKKERIGSLADLIDRDHLTLLCIDHHPSDRDLPATFAIDSQACSTGSMIYSLFKECGYDLTYEAACGLYTSIICDTGRFCYSSTNRKAHKIADECMKLGVDPDKMYSKLYQNISFEQFKVFARALNKMRRYLDGKVLIQEICLEDYRELSNENLEIESLHELNKWMEEVDCSIILLELPGHKVRLSGRSKSGLNIAQVMRSFGGGGHAKAAGALIEGSIQQAKEKVLQSVLQENLAKKQELDYNLSPR